jgi:hypothetical protein
MKESSAEWHVPAQSAIQRSTEPQKPRATTDCSVLLIRRFLLDQRLIFSNKLGSIRERRFLFSSVGDHASGALADLHSLLLLTIVVAPRPHSYGGCHDN